MTTRKNITKIMFNDQSHTDIGCPSAQERERERERERESIVTAATGTKNRGRKNKKLIDSNEQTLTGDAKTNQSRVAQNVTPDAAPEKVSSVPMPESHPDALDTNGYSRIKFQEDNLKKREELLFIENSGKESPILGCDLTCSTELTPSERDCGSDDNQKSLNEGENLEFSSEDDSDGNDELIDNLTNNVFERRPRGFKYDVKKKVKLKHFIDLGAGIETCAVLMHELFQAYFDAKREGYRLMCMPVCFLLSGTIPGIRTVISPFEITYDPSKKQDPFNVRYYYNKIIAQHVVKKAYYREDHEELDDEIYFKFWCKKDGLKIEKIKRLQELKRLATGVSEPDEKIYQYLPISNNFTKNRAGTEFLINGNRFLVSDTGEYPIPELVYEKYGKGVEHAAVFMVDDNGDAVLCFRDFICDQTIDSSQAVDPVTNLSQKSGEIEGVSIEEGVQTVENARVSGEFGSNETVENESVSNETNSHGAVSIETCTKSSSVVPHVSEGSTQETQPQVSPNDVPLNDTWIRVVWDVVRCEQLKPEVKKKGADEQDYSIYVYKKGKIHEWASPVRSCKFVNGHAPRISPTDVVKSVHEDRKFGVFDIETVKLNDKGEIDKNGNELCPFAVGTLFGGTGNYNRNKQELKLYYVTDYPGNDLREKARNMLFDMFKGLLRIQNRGYKVYAHNLAGFDGPLIVQYLAGIPGVRVRPRMVGTKTYSIELSMEIDKMDAEWRASNIGPRGGDAKMKEHTRVRIVLGDSFLMLPASLRELGKLFDVENPKGEFPHDFVNESNLEYIGPTPYKQPGDPGYEPEWSLKASCLTYLTSDLKCLYEVIMAFERQMRNDYGLNIHSFLTTASMTMEVFLTNFFKNSQDSKLLPILSGACAGFIRMALKGGNTTVFKPVSDEKLYHYDVTSLYPYAMLNDMPVGRPIHCFNPSLDDEFFGFCRAIVETPPDMQRPFLQAVVGSRTVNPIGTFEGYWFSEELKEAKRLGYKVKILEGYAFKRGKNIFNAYILHFFKKKAEAVDTAERFIFKLFLNSFFGRWGMRDCPQETEIMDWKSFKKVMDERVINTAWLIDKHSENNNVMATYEKLPDYDLIGDDDKLLEEYMRIDKNPFKHVTSIGIAAATTAYARIHMYKYTSDDQVFYTDTDSCYTTKKLPDDETGNKLGQMKLEGMPVRAVFAAEKCYYTVDESGKFTVKHTGVPKALACDYGIDQLYDGNSLELVVERIQRVQTGGLIHKRVNVKIDPPPRVGKRIKIFDVNGNWIDTAPLMVRYDSESGKNVIIEYDAQAKYIELKQQCHAVNDSAQGLRDVREVDKHKRENENSNENEREHTSIAPNVPDLRDDSSLQNEQEQQVLSVIDVPCPSGPIRGHNNMIGPDNIDNSVGLENNRTGLKGPDLIKHMVEDLEKQRSVALSTLENLDNKILKLRKLQNRELNSVPTDKSDLQKGHTNTPEPEPKPEPDNVPTDKNDLQKGHTNTPEPEPVQEPEPEPTLEKNQLEPEIQDST